MPGEIQWSIFPIQIDCISIINLLCSSELTLDFLLLVAIHQRYESTPSRHRHRLGDTSPNLRNPGWADIWLSNSRGWSKSDSWLCYSWPSVWRRVDPHDIAIAWAMRTAIPLAWALGGFITKHVTMSCRFRWYCQLKCLEIFAEHEHCRSSSVWRRVRLWNTPCSMTPECPWFGRRRIIWCILMIIGSICYLHLN